MITDNKHNDSRIRHPDDVKPGAGSGSGLVDSRDSSDSLALQGPQQSQGGQEPDDSAGTPVLAGAADSGASCIRAGQTLVVEAERLAGFVRTQTARATPQRIVESLTTLVSTEVLPEGTRLPTVRALAAALRVSPATVSAAYHMLARSGVIHSRGRAGTFVLPQALSEVNIPPASAASFAGGTDGWGARTTMPSVAGARAVFDMSDAGQILGMPGDEEESRQHNSEDAGLDVERDAGRATGRADGMDDGMSEGYADGRDAEPNHGRKSGRNNDASASRTSGASASGFDRRASGQMRGFAAVQAPVIDLSRGTPDNTLLPPIRPYLARLGNRRAFVNSYTGPTILPMLEEELRGDWPYDPQAMTMVSGAGDGLALAIATFVRHGDVVIVESPTYPFILDVLRESGAIAVGVPVDAEGMDPNLLFEVLERFSPSAGPTHDQGRRIGMIIIQPRAQNPTGISYTPQRLSVIARVLRMWEQEAAGREIPPILEDDSSGMVADVFAVSLGSLLPDRVIHIRSFSKSHGPDLRLAALSGTREAVDAIVERRRLGAGWVSRFLQELLCEMLADRQAYSTIAGARHTYALRRKTMAALLERFGMQTVLGSGFNMWLPVRDTAAARRILAQEHIRVAEGGRFLPEFRVSASDDGSRVQECVIGGDDWADGGIVGSDVIAGVAGVERTAGVDVAGAGGDAEVGGVAGTGGVSAAGVGDTGCRAGRHIGDAAYHVADTAGIGTVGAGGFSPASTIGIDGTAATLLTDAGVTQGNAMRVTISQPEAITERVAQCLVQAATA